MAQPQYAERVFINIPFDPKYKGILEAIVFALIDCGFRPLCALEHIDSGDIRIEKICRLIESSQFGIHDISCTKLDANNHLPRFNMPFELGIFLGAKRFGDRRQQNKKCLVLDSQRHRYQKFLSDIAGQDVAAHGHNARTSIKVVRDWLSCNTRSRALPGPDNIWKQFRLLQAALPKMCRAVKMNYRKITYRDYVLLVCKWLKKAAP